MQNTINMLNNVQVNPSKNINHDLSSNFSNVLKKSIDEVNTTQIVSDEYMANIATGEVKNLDQAVLAINKAETSMKLMLEVRNKAINAYKEIIKTQM